jgi:threonine synthase
MEFVSTRGIAPTATLREALFRGLAPDGGLYVPVTLPSLPPSEMDSLVGTAWLDVASKIADHLLAPTGTKVDVSRTETGPGTRGSEVAEQALDFPVPLVRIKERLFVLELFRGPTLAFKDVGARFMARLMDHYRKEEDAPLTILTATSGDTGGAVAHAFLGLPGVRVVILFPDGKVTPRQERQFSTLGENVRAVAVRGDFDDCQRLAKAAFGDEELREATALTSANSINVGRLLPQTFYYFHAWAQLATSADEFRPHSAAGTGTAPHLLFSVPSGNFGNLAAGLMAKAMGLPGSRFLAATNANDGFVQYLRTGRFTPTPSVRTLSTAMDVGNPSNLARILHLYGEDVGRLREDLRGRSVSDEETLACIRRTFHEAGYVLDPHSAVGYAALEAELAARPEVTGVLLATAHPAKFAEVVEPALGQSLPVPPELARCLEGERKVVPLEPDSGALRDLLLEG